MAQPYDAIVIGAGSNGLVTAAYLARARQRVLILEQQEQVGGLGAGEEFAPGFYVDAMIGAGWIPRLVIADLKLSQHGCEVNTDPALFAPQPDGSSLVLTPDVRHTTENIRRFSPRDADRWPAFVTFVQKVAALLESAYLTTPPNGLDATPGDVPVLMGLALKLRRMGDRDMMETLRVLPMSAEEFLGDWFESEVLKGALGFDAVQHIQQGPYSAGTAFVFLHHQVGKRDGAVRIGLRVRNADTALAAAAHSFGAEIRTGVSVAQVLIEEGRATGVVLDSGEEIAARYVVSSADPYNTFLRLVDPLELPADFVRAVRHIKFRGATAKIYLALGERPDFSALPGDGPHLRSAICISPSLQYLERAYDSVKYHQISEHPALEIRIPTLDDPSLAPAGQHVMAITAQYAPYSVEGGWDAARREALLDNVLNTLDEVAPNIKNAILLHRIITPLDLEQDYRLTEGSLNHGEMMLDQLYFMRPVGGWSQYRTPIGGLYLCGAGAHPGGGVIGAPGYNASREILSDGR